MLERIMEEQDYSKVVSFPAKLILFFLIFTELLLFWGPIDYDIKSPVLLFIYLLVLNISLYAGFKSVITRLPSFQYNCQISLSYLKVVIFWGFCVLILRFVNGWNLSSFSPSVFFIQIQRAIFSPADVYNEKLESVTTNGLMLLLMVITPVYFISKVFGVYYWNSLNRKYKFIVFLLYFLDIIYWLGLGTRKGLLDIIITLVFLLICRNPTVLYDRKKKRKLIVLIATTGGLFILYFVISNFARFNLSSTEGLIESRFIIRDFYKENVPSSVYIPLAEITSYLCQGYVNLGCALSDFFNHGIFCFTFGIGNNWFTINVVENLFHGTDIIDLTYQGYLYKEYGVDMYASWHSLYLWLANDFTFFGVPFIIYFLGKQTLIIWSKAICGNNSYSVPLFILLIIELFYVFANNQVLSFSFVSFIVVLFLYRNRFYI